LIHNYEVSLILLFFLLTWLPIRIYVVISREVFFNQFFSLFFPSLHKNGTTLAFDKNIRKVGVKIYSLRSRTMLLYGKPLAEKMEADLRQQVHSTF